MTKTVLPGVPHIPKTPDVGYLGPDLAPPKIAKVKQTTARVWPLKRTLVPTAKMKPAKDEFS